VGGLNVYDLLRYDHLILTEGALKSLEERLAA
jgi:ribosomal protein L4